MAMVMVVVPVFTSVFVMMMRRLASVFIILFFCCFVHFVLVSNAFRKRGNRRRATWTLPSLFG